MSVKEKIIALLLFVSFSAGSDARAEGPISQYCHQVRAQLRKCWQPSPEFAKVTNMDFEVGTDGEIGSVQASKYNDGSPAGQAAAMAMLKGVKKLDAPPDDVPKPIWLCAQFGNKMDDLEVGWRDVNAMQYMRIVQSKIKQNWYPPKDVPPSRVVLAFKIHSDGQMSDLQLATKSGTEKIDKVALTAATQAAPFPPLPDGCFESISIQFTLDYNQHPKP